MFLKKAIFSSCVVFHKKLFGIVFLLRAVELSNGKLLMSQTISKLSLESQNEKMFR